MSKMSKKFFLAKIGLSVIMVVVLMKCLKKFEGCNPLERCDNGRHTFADDEMGSGYFEKIQKSLRSSGLQSVIQDEEGRENAIEIMEDINKNISSVLSLTHSEAHQDISGESQIGNPEKGSTDVFGLKKNEVKISDILTFPKTTQSSGFQGNAIRKNSKEDIPSLKKEEQHATNELIFRNMTKLKRYGRTIIHFEPEEDDKVEREREGHDESKEIERNDDDSDDDEDDESEDDVTIYQPNKTLDCPGNSDRYILQDLLSMWDQEATKHEIVYFLAYGSLLGYHRNGNVLPWDTDVDVFIGAQSYSQIRDIAVPRNFKYIKHDKTARLVIQTDIRFPSENRTRVSCDGRIVPRSIDGCSFQDPIARVVRGNRHLDIFEVYHLNSTFLYEPILKHSFDVSELYPPKPCVFMGIKTSCPSNVPAVLRRKYGPDFNVPAKMCVDGQWRERGTLPQ